MMRAVRGISVVVCDPQRTVAEAVATSLEQLSDVRVRAIETHFVEALHVVNTQRPEVVIVSPDLLRRPLGIVIAAFVYASPRSGFVVITSDPHALPESFDGVIRLLSREYTMADIVDAVHHSAAAIRAGARSTVRSFECLDGGVAARLTARERQVLECLVEGLDPTDIGRRLRIKTSTARTHMKNLYQRLAVHSAAEAVALVRIP
jgi:DNA-binding NarL/FixJ family response regulator